MRTLCSVVLLLFTTAVAGQNEHQHGAALESEDIQKIKAKYQLCVITKGKELLQLTSFRDAVDFAPVACRRELLQMKKFLLDSAFRVEVIDQLVSSVEEGIKINLVNALIDEMNDDNDANAKPPEN